MPTAPSRKPCLESLESRLNPATPVLYPYPVPTGPQVAQPFQLGPGSMVASLGEGKVGIWSANDTYQEIFPFPGYAGPLTVQGASRGASPQPDSIIIGVAGRDLPHVLVVDATTGKVALSFFAFDPLYRGGVSVAGGLTQRPGGAQTILLCGALQGNQSTLAVFDAVTGEYIGGEPAFDKNHPGAVRSSLSQNNTHGDSLVVAASTVDSLVSGFDLGSLDGNFSVLWNLTPTFPNAFSTHGVNAVVGDLDGDDLPEIVVGAGEGQASPQIQVYSFKNALPTLVKTFNAFATGFQGGVRVALADRDADGHLDILASSGPGARGTLNVFRYSDLQVMDALFVNDNLQGVNVGNIFPDPWFFPTTPLDARWSGPPNLTATYPVDLVRVLFNRDVTGVDLADFNLQRVVDNPLDPLHPIITVADLPGNAVLTILDGSTCELTGLSFFTNEPGGYSIWLKPDAAIQDTSGNFLTQFTGDSWSMVPAN